MLKKNFKNFLAELKPKLMTITKAIFY